MEIIKHFGFGLLAFIIGLYAFSNILLPLFYSLPKFIKEKKRGSLNRKIPYILIIWPSMLWLVILIAGFFYSHNKIPDKTLQILIGLGISLILIIGKLIGKSEDIEYDFYRNYKNYFK